MAMNRRDFVRGGVAAFTVGFAAPSFLTDIARAQGRSRRNLVVLYLSGGNDGLSTLIPYTDPQVPTRAGRIWRFRRPTSCRLAPTAPAMPLGLNPRLTDLRTIFNSGRLAIIQRTGYQQLEPLAFSGHRHLVDRRPVDASGRRLAGPLSRSHAGAGRSADRLVHGARNPAHAARAHGWRCRQSRASPNTPLPARTAAPRRRPRGRARPASRRTCPVDQPHLAFVNSTAQAAFATLDRVAQVATYAPTVTYPNNGFGQALQMVAGAISRGIGTSVYWVQTGGYDTHAGQNTNVANGSYNTLMTTLNGGLFAFYRDMLNQGLLSDTLVIQFSEFGRRISENGSNGTDHGAASLMMAMGGGVRGGIYGTAPNLRIAQRQPDARERQSGRALRDRLPIGLRADHRQLAGRATRRRFLAGTYRNGPSFI